MTAAEHPFTFKCLDEHNVGEYLGSDNLPIAETYNLYLDKCEEFKIKAKKYSKGNLWLKNSYLQHIKLGYEGSEELEKKVLQKREEDMMQYMKAFNITSFDENPNSMYECFKGKNKKIRIIRELLEERNEEFSEDFNIKGNNWFKRYCILSKFIQAARKIILYKRLEKALTLLRPQIAEMMRQKEEELKALKSDSKTLKSGSKIIKKKIYCTEIKVNI